MTTGAPNFSIWAILMMRFAATALDLIPGPYVTIDVEDTGTGMDDATRAAISSTYQLQAFVPRSAGFVAASSPSTTRR